MWINSKQTKLKCSWNEFWNLISLLNYNSLFVNWNGQEMFSSHCFDNGSSSNWTRKFRNRHTNPKTLEFSANPHKQYIWGLDFVSLVRHQNRNYLLNQSIERSLILWSQIRSRSFGRKVILDQIRSCFVKVIWSDLTWSDL